MFKRLWQSYYGQCLCRMIGHKKYVAIPYKYFPATKYLGCARCHTNLGGSVR